MSKENFRTGGGPGSGNFGHAGRPGQVGGSAKNGDGPVNQMHRVGDILSRGRLRELPREAVHRV